MREVQLTPTELKIIKLICKQLKAKEIAEKMGLSFRTVEGYKENIMRKIRARNIVGIALYACKAGIIKI